MIYPRTKSKKGSRQSRRAKKNFLNPYQREELKKRLTEKFTKLYGLNNPNAVKVELNNFFKHNSEINASNLRALEQRVKVACLRGKSLAQPPSHVSGRQVPTVAHNAQRQGAGPMIATHNARSTNSKGSRGSRTNQLPKLANNGFVESQNVGDLPEDPIGLSHLNQDNQWAAINKYNNYLYQQEKKLDKMREIESKRQMKLQLDEQIRQKEFRKQKKKDAHQSYVNAENRLMVIDSKKEANRQKLKQDKMKFEKEMRDLQMREIEERKRFEHEQEKTLDAYILGKIKQELKEEQETQARKKLEKKNLMKQMMVENNQRKRRLLELQEQERLEDIELQKQAIVISEKLEKARQEEFKQKANAISKMIQNSQDKVQDIKNKNYEMEMKNQRYNELREQCLKRKEERNKVLAHQRKLQLRKFLDHQVEDKKRRSQFDSARDNEQAKIWQKEADDFSNFRKTRQSFLKNQQSNYRQDLMDQMEEKRLRERQAKGGMTNEEAAMNRLLLSKLAELRTTNMAAEEKQRRQPLVNNIFQC